MCTMGKRLLFQCLGVIGFLFSLAACKTPTVVSRSANPALPANYGNAQSATNSAQVNWKEFFTDPNLVALIDTALKNNQELNVTLQEIEIARNEVRARKGEYLPFVGLRAGTAVEKTPRFTRLGAVQATTEIEPGKEMPEPLHDFTVGAYANWEADIWRKLRNARKAATARYLSTVEGRNFMVTNLVAEIANTYYELLALDNQLEIVRQNIEIQSNALEVVRFQKQAARVTELAVKKFEAQVLNTRALQFNIQQQITIAENRLHFLTGRYPRLLARSSASFNTLALDTVYAGLPAQLLENRPDIRQAELELQAAKLDVQVAKARFYPALGITAGVGIQAFELSYLAKSPESVLFSLAGDLMAPLVNRNAIKAFYISANARQLQAVYNYERTVLNAYLEAANQLSNLSNLRKSYDLKAKEVQALTESVNIANELYRSARADYMEILMTQRDALDSRFDLIETRMQQMNAKVNFYRALGGGWNR